MFYDYYIYNVYVMFYYEIPWFHQDFKSENLFFKSVLTSCSDNTAPVTRDQVKYSQTRNGTNLQL